MPMNEAIWENAVLELLQQAEPSLKGSRVTVALSGGADSVALCHFLAKWAQRLQICVAAAHLNHGLRGAESDRDEAFVRALCREWSIPLQCGRLPAAAHASEAALREKRYAFLWQAAGSGFLATGHTLSDSCETLLFHLARGTRLNGMRGIPPQRGRLLRPFAAAVRRTDTEAYCRSNGLSFVIDSTNLSDTYARNRLRHAAMPALCSVNPRAEQALGDWMTEAEALYGWLGQQADTLLAQAVRPHAAVEKNALPGTPVWQAEVLAAAPDVVLRQALAGVLGTYGDCSAARLAAAVQAVRSGGAVDWCAGVRLVCRGGLVWLQDTAAPTAEAPPHFCVPAAPGRYECAPGVVVSIRLLQGESACLRPDGSAEAPIGENDGKKRKIHKKDLNNRLDYARITSMFSLSPQPLKTDADGWKTAVQADLFPPDVPLLRFRAPHDRFSPGRGRGTKSLKKWLNEIACPPSLRGRLPLIAVGSQVLWLAGSGAAEGFAAAENASAVWEVLCEISTTEGSSL